MNKSKQHLNTIKPEQLITDKQLKALFLVQLKKDFSTVNIKLDIDDETISLTEIKNRIKNVLIENFTNKLLTRLLYTIDINEEKISEIILKSKSNYIDNIVEQIIIREMQKIIIRHYYNHIDRG
jgi:predicted ATP-grasp superfamily ATP-dependent carboligase